MDAIEEQLELNYKAFEALLPTLLASHRGQFALMRNGEIVEFFETAGDACLAGEKLFPADRLYSVQEVDDTPVDLGFYSHALPLR